MRLAVCQCGWAGIAAMAGLVVSLSCPRCDRNLHWCRHGADAMVALGQAWHRAVLVAAVDHVVRGDEVSSDASMVSQDVLRLVASVHSHAGRSSTTLAALDGGQVLETLASLARGAVHDALARWRQSSSPPGGP